MLYLPECFVSTLKIKQNKGTLIQQNLRGILKIQIEP